MAALSTPLHAAFSNLASLRSATYRNPVQPGDFPDPSIIRVGKQDFYAVMTSTDWAPEFPIFHSRDLVEWSLVGSVFAERPPWAVGNFWAPEFAEFDGRFYIYYVARMIDGPLSVAVASADHPAGPYVDHGPLVGQNDGSIDPMATLDENGDRWLIWKEDGNSVSRPTPIWAQRLGAGGLSVFGERHELIRNDAAWEGHVVEAPVIMRRDGWFYMLYSGNACCGAECAYAVGVARSRTLLGPWEKCPRNPILAGNEAWRCPGHGSVTTDARGRTFFLYHAYAHASDSVYVGRQVLLDEIRWGADGWPSINNGNGPSRFALAPFGPRRRRRSKPFVEDFTRRELSSGWQRPQSLQAVAEVDRRRAELVLRARRPGHRPDPLDAVMARPATTGDYAATAVINARNQNANVIASLTAYGDRKNALGIGVRNGRIILWRRKRGAISVSDQYDLPASCMVHVRMTVSAGHKYRFAFSADGKRWTECRSRLDGAYLPPWDRGVRVALTAGGTLDAEARFGLLRIAATGTEIASLEDRKAAFERHRMRLRRMTTATA
ncbi:MAG: family 43 glycosylhydrolase [Candidatus Velthaea sp.]